MMGNGIFGNMFDFNQDGSLDAIERAIEFQFFDEVVMGNDSDEDIEAYENDFDYDL